MYNFKLDDKVQLILNIKWYLPPLSYLALSGLFLPYILLSQSTTNYLIKIIMIKQGLLSVQVGRLIQIFSY